MSEAVVTVVTRNDYIGAKQAALKLANFGIRQIVFSDQELASRFLVRLEVHQRLHQQQGSTLLRAESNLSQESYRTE